MVELVRITPVRMDQAPLTITFTSFLVCISTRARGAHRASRVRV